MLNLSDEFRALAQSNLKHLPRLGNFEPTTQLDDFLSLEKFEHQAARISKYITLTNNLKVLEIGSGYGIALALFITKFKFTGFGIEPLNSADFPSGAIASRLLLQENGIDPSCIVEAYGEEIPFRDDSFDLVYSFNVLEHTRDPHAVLNESLRVLKPGGILFFEIPNFFSFFEGHYYVFTPPIVSKRLFGYLIRFIYRRNLDFLEHLHTEINPFWVVKALRQLKHQYSFELLSLGEMEFETRLKGEFQFEHKSSLIKLRPLVDLILRINQKLPISKLFILTKTFYPIYLVLRKTHQAQDLQ